VDWIRVWAARAVALAGFAAFALLTAPGPGWLDSSELAAASFQLGSPPSTGFPLLCMLGKLASWLPVGEIGFRLHLLGAACAALAMLWTARLVAGATSRPGEGSAGLAGGLVAALLVGVTLAFARQATVTDVMAPTAALLAATFLLFDRVARGADARCGLLLAVVVGLGLATHASYRLVVPLPLLALLWIRLRRGARWPLAVPLVTLSVGAALHLYLPVRSVGGRTAVDRGQPRDLEALALHAAGQPLRDAVAGELAPLEPELAAVRARSFVAAQADQIGVLGAIAALAGALALLIDRRSRWLLILVLSAAAGDAAVAIWIDPSAGDAALFALACAALAGAGVAWLARFAGTRAGAATAAAAGAMLLVGPALVTWSALGPVTGDAPRRHAEAALEATPAGGVLLARTDTLAGLALFLSVAEGARPDVTPLHRASLDPRSDAIRGRAIAWELGGEDVPADAIEMRSSVGVLVSPGSAAPGDVARAAGRVIAVLGGDRDPIAQRIAAEALTSLARLARARADLPLAQKLYEGARALDPGQGHRAALPGQP
jgi:hypothetical protein